MSAPRLLVLALDAADPDLVRGWADQGHLPAIAAVLRQGFRAPVDTPPALLESALWPTYLTGTTAGAHGMFANVRLRPGTYDLEEAMRADRLPFAPFWVHLSRAGHRVAVIDAPFARPTPLPGGLQLTNWGAHDAWAWPRSSWPAELAADLVRRFGRHPVGRCDARNRGLAGLQDLRARLLAGVRRKTALLRHCLRLAEWDLVFGVFSEPHCAGHQLWHLHDPDHPQHDAAAPPALRSAIRDVYQEIDAGVAALLEDVGPNCHVLLLLSHGMGPRYEASHLLDPVLARLEADAGHDGSVATPARRVHAAGHLLWQCGRLLPAALHHRLLTRMPGAVWRLWKWTHRDALTAWRSRLAFAVPGHGMTGAIRINLAGREPCGRVQPGPQYDALCRGLVERLGELESTATGGPAVARVARADRLYRGPWVAAMPDLLVEWNHRAPIEALSSPRVGTISGSLPGCRTGQHRDGGLLAGMGPTFRTGRVTSGLAAEDLAPTLLELLGVVPPAVTEGTSRLDLLRSTRVT